MMDADDGLVVAPSGWCSSVKFDVAEVHPSLLELLGEMEPFQVSRGGRKYRRPEEEKMDSIKTLRKVLKKKVVDTFDVGTVIRWTAAGRYTYAAIKTPVGWFTTSRAYNQYVPQVVSYDELVDLLLMTETTDVEVATQWEKVG